MNIQFMNRTGRRTFLKGLGAGAGLFIPFLRKLEAQAVGKAPLRFIFFFTPNGHHLKSFGADGGETGHTFTNSLKPFDRADFRSNISLLKNLELKNEHPDSRGHGNACGILTCQMPTGDFPRVAGGASFDNHLASFLKVTPLNLGVCMDFAGGYHLSWDGPGKVTSVTVDPRMALQGMFGAVPGMAQPVPVAMPMAAGVTNRKKVHDLLVQEIKEFRKRVPAADRDGLDLYLAKVEGLAEKAMPPSPSGGGSEAAMCSAPDLSGNVSINSKKDVVALGNMHMNLIVSAFACGLTRVATLQWGTSTYGANIGNPGSSQDHHETSHWFPDSTPAAQEQCDTAYATQFVNLLEKLKAIPEGDGTLLDNTLVLWGTEISDEHLSSHTTFIIAGEKGSRLRTGRNFDMQKASLADLYVSMQNEFGNPSGVFGDPNFCSGGLKNLFTV